ncbi:MULTISPECIES: hypothetical protein [unclassified Paenibacillus]
MTTLTGWIIMMQHGGVFTKMPLDDFISYVFKKSVLKTIKVYKERSHV